MNSVSDNAVICKLIPAVQEFTKSADRKLIRSNTDWTQPEILKLSFLSQSSGAGKITNECIRPSSLQSSSIVAHSVF
jgi:hypothetical protein